MQRRMSEPHGRMRHSCHHLITERAHACTDGTAAERSRPSRSPDGWQAAGHAPQHAAPRHASAQADAHLPCIALAESWCACHLWVPHVHLGAAPLACMPAFRVASLRPTHPPLPPKHRRRRLLHIAPPAPSSPLPSSPLPSPSRPPLAALPLHAAHMRFS